MEIVKFRDGNFGVRKFSIFYLGYGFLDLVSPNYFWGRGSIYFYSDCRGTFKQAKEAMEKFLDKETPVCKSCGESHKG